eukprot:tig00021070_g17828.t1
MWQRDENALAPHELQLSISRGSTVLHGVEPVVCAPSSPAIRHCTRWSLGKATLSCVPAAGLLSGQMARERAAKRARAAAGDAPAAGGGTVSAGSSSSIASAATPVPRPVPSTSAGAAAAAGQLQASAATLSRVAAAMAAGGSPFDALPDELVARIIAKASETSYTEIGSIKAYSGSSRSTDQDLCELVQLSHVSRRFRSLALQPSLWERIFIRPASDKVVDALLNHDQPKARREALRSLCLEDGDLSDSHFSKLSKMFGMQLTELRIAFKSVVSPGILPTIQHFSRLEQVYIARISSDCIPLEDNLELALEFSYMSMTLETLQALAPLAPTLKRLRCGIFATGALLPIFSSIAAFQKLEQLKIECFDEEGSQIWPRASEADLQPLSGLSSLRAYAVLVYHMHTGFLSGMRQLEFICLNMRGPADISALLPLAGSLQSAIITHENLDEAASASFAAGASKLVALESLHLMLPSRAFSTFAQLSLQQWTSLKSLTLECMEGDAEIPGAFFKRLASDVPSLQNLTVKSPLPLSSAGGLVAVSALKRLRRLVIEGDAADLGDDGRRALQAALRDVQIAYK